MLTKFYLISTLLIGTSAALAMDGDSFIYDFSDSEGENSKSLQSPMTRGQSSTSGIRFPGNESDSLESGSTSAASESDSDGERRRSQKSMLPSPFYKDTPNGKNRRAKTAKEQCDSVERTIRSGSLLGDFTETEENSGNTKKRIFESREEGVTTTFIFTSYKNTAEQNSRKKKKSLEPSQDQRRIDGFTARGVDESKKRTSLPLAPKKLEKSKGKGFRKSFPPAGTDKQRIDHFFS